MKIHLTKPARSLIPGDVVSWEGQTFLVVNKATGALSHWIDININVHVVVVMCLTSSVGHITWFNDATTLKYEGRLEVNI